MSLARRTSRWLPGGVIFGLLPMMTPGAVVAADATADAAALLARIERLEQRVAREEDRVAIEKLTRAYGYYNDKKLWNEVMPLFADDAVVEISGRGVYRGAESIGTFFHKVIGRGADGLAKGELSNHMVLQGIVDVAPDGRTATGRWRAFIQIGMWQQAALWAEGTYDIGYVRRNGVWQFSRMTWYGTYFTPYDEGWAKVALGNNAPSREYPPDAPPSRQYDAYPGHFVPPFPYPNPVTGRPWTEADSLRHSTQGMDSGAPANAADSASPLAAEGARAPAP